jgi:NADPH-dependent 2,4-dienoyl-CoA reductase/sulfur reductase-like enzyme
VVYRTLVGAGLKNKTATRKPLASILPPYFSHISESAKSFSPSSSSLTTSSGRSISYGSLVVATGLQINWNAISGLPKALADSNSGVSSIYSYDTADKVWSDIEALRSGNAIFTQPAGIVKCAGAPQKIMYMAWDRFRLTKRGDNIKTAFYTGMPTMFSVPKYSQALDKLRSQRGIDAHFNHNLVSIDSTARKATFKKQDGSTVDVDYTLLHVVPPMGPLDCMKGQPISDEAGWVNVDKQTLRHVEFDNVWALGDCSSLPTSKTAAAISSQAPVLSENLFQVMDTGSLSKAKYDGYTSCPVNDSIFELYRPLFTDETHKLLTGYGELMLAEFKYGLEPKESFASVLGDQAVPRRSVYFLPTRNTVDSDLFRVFYHLKKDVFPRVYWSYMVRGQWYGPSGPIRPDYS